VSGKTTIVVVPASNAGDSSGLVGASSLRHPRATSDDGMPHGGNPALAPAAPAEEPAVGAAVAAPEAAPFGGVGLAAELLVTASDGSGAGALVALAAATTAGAADGSAAFDELARAESTFTALECAAQPSANQAPVSAIGEYARLTPAS